MPPEGIFGDAIDSGDGAHSVLMTGAIDGDRAAGLRTRDGIGMNDRLDHRARRDHKRQPNRGDCRRLPAAELARRGIDKQTSTMLCLTWMIALLTLANVASPRESL